MKYIIHINNEITKYMLEEIADDAVLIVCRAWSEYSQLQKLFIYLSSICRLPKFLYRIFTPYRELLSLSKNDVVIAFDIYMEWQLQSINNMLPREIKRYIWYWNPVNKYTPDDKYSYFYRLKKIGFTLSTFDPDDADKYGMVLKHQIYRKVEIPICDINFDLYFLGKDKGRREILNELIHILAEKCILKFLIVKSPCDYITYEQNLINVSSSRCGVEILQEGKTGLSLRAMEALFCKKKLITNCKQIISEDFYHPNNVFVIGVDNINCLQDFLDREYFNISSDIINSYTVKSWLNSFL